MARNRRRIDRTESARRLKTASGRILRLLAIASGVFAGLTATGYGGLTAYTWLTHAPRFGISGIAVEGGQRASNDELIRLSGLQLGQNIFKADLATAAQQVATHRWVKTASVERKGATEVRIVVEERQPSVFVDLGRLYIADAEGVIFKRLDGDRLDLPVVSGISRQSYEQDPEGTREALLEAEHLVELYRTRGLDSGGAIEEIAVDPDRALSLVVGGGQTILLGLAPFEGKLDHLGAIRTELRRRGATAEVIHLESQARPDWVPVKLGPVIADASKVHAAPTGRRTTTTPTPLAGPDRQGGDRHVSN